jgi:hypothetical protein
MVIFSHIVFLLPKVGFYADFVVIGQYNPKNYICQDAEAAAECQNYESDTCDNGVNVEIFSQTGGHTCYHSVF